MGTRGDNRTIKQGKGSCRAFQDDTGTFPAPEQLLQSLLHSPKKPEEITDKSWGVPAWVLGKEKGEKAPECTLGPHTLIPLPQAPGWSIPLLPVPFQGGKSKVTPRDGHGREAEENSAQPPGCCWAGLKIHQEGECGLISEKICEVGGVLARKVLISHRIQLPGIQGSAYASCEGAGLGHGRV